MIDSLYQTLSKIGFAHPLHPPITHLSLGLIIGGFIFAVVALVFNKKSFLQTARHCMVLALIGLGPTVLIGLADWQHYYGGALLFPITMKMILAAVLVVCLSVAVKLGLRKEYGPMRVIPVYTLCLMAAIGIGYFGGELVYGTRPAAGNVRLNPVAGKGAALFSESCSVCHFHDKTETKVGPGLKGLFEHEKLPISGRPATESNVRLTLKTPFDKMPRFDSLSEEQIDQLIAFLKTL
ncbi:MAG: c-type cytochrome [Desulfobacterales bacterium]